MSTVTQLVNKVFAQYLHPGDEQPVTATLSSDITAGDTSVPYSDLTLYPDEEDLLAPGVIIEFEDGDQCRITAVDDTADTLTVTRGVNGKTATVHSSGDEFVVAPVYDRAGVIEAVYDNVVDLYPELFQVTTSTVTIGSGYTEVSASVVNARSFTWLDGSNYREALATLLPDFPPSSTGKAISTPKVTVGATGYFTWDGRFDRPTAVTDDVADLGVRPEWERIVIVGAAAQALAGRPPSQATTEYVTQQLARESMPAGATTDIRNGLLTLHRLLMERAAAGLDGERQPAVVYNSIMGAAR